MLRKAVLGPWDPLVSYAWRYFLARAAQRHSVAVHHTMLAVNHHHTIVTPNRKNISCFLRDLHQPMSVLLNALLKKRGYDPMGQVFEARHTHRMRLLDPEAMVQHLMYQQMQNVAAGLVKRPEEMPGNAFSFDDWGSESMVMRHPMRILSDPSCEGQRIGATDEADERNDIRERFTAPPELIALFDGDRAKLRYSMVRQERETLAAMHDVRRMRARSEGRQRARYRGAEAVLRIHPYDEPRTPPEPHADIVPTFRVGASGEEGRRLRILAGQDIQAFRDANRECSIRWRKGERGVVFPYGTDLLERQFGATVAEEPPDNAIVTAPGLLPSEVAKRYPSRTNPTLSKHVVHVLDTSREELREELEHLPDHVGSRYRRRRNAPDADGDAAEQHVDERPTGEQVRRNDIVRQSLASRRRTSVDAPPARIVVLRSREDVQATGERRANAPPHS